MHRQRELQNKRFPLNLLCAKQTQWMCVIVAAPKGNHNARGNKGGGAPRGNKNALKHGGYSKIEFDTLTDEEREIFDTLDSDAERLIIDEIALLTIRELRIQKKISQLRDSKKGTVTKKTERKENRYEFSDDSERALFEQIQKQMIAAGKLPGHEYKLSITEIACYEVILRLEEALTRCQAQKLNCIKVLISLRRGKNECCGTTDPLFRVIDALTKFDAEDVIWS